METTRALEKHFEQESTNLQISFEFMGKNFKTTHEQVFKQNGEPLESNFSIGIYDEDNFLHGNIEGKLLEKSVGEAIFLSNNIRNFHSNKNLDKNKNPEKHIPRIIKETIIQLILQENISLWLSSGTLIENGHKTYQQIEKDIRVNCAKIDLDYRRPPVEKGILQSRYFISKARRHGYSDNENLENSS